MKIFILFFFLSTSLCAQEKSQSHSDSIIYERVSKNIAAYNIRYANYKLNRISFNQPFERPTDFFYEPFLPDFGYKLDMNIKHEINEEYPINAYDIYSIRLPYGLKYTNSATGESKRTIGHDVGLLYYIALNSKTGDIKFISGQFFLSKISQDFKLDINHPTSYITFLKFRLKAFGIDDITFKKRSGKKFIFTAYHTESRQLRTVILDSENLEYPKIL